MWSTRSAASMNDVDTDKRRQTMAVEERLLTRHHLLDIHRSIHPPGHVPAAWLHHLAALVNPRRLGRSNPREAKRSHTYPRKRADRTLRPPPRGHLTLVLLPLP
jgi:hypothetical protein